MSDSEKTTRIALCMIVKNEAAILERCLHSVLPLISAACICDTGSTDATPELADQTLTTAGVPHALRSHDWVNFGVNRTLAFAATQDLARELGWDLSHSYALFLDADMQLKIDPCFDPAELTADGYSLQQHDGTLVYSNLRLARLSLNWRSIGPTHEYWAAEEAGELPPLSSLSIDHIGDGGTKKDKFKRDIELLETELASNQNLRTIFYLARSYEDVGRFEDAQRLYDVRASAGGWEEEAWYATYRSGMCSIQLGDWAKGVYGLLSAWERRPQRAEPLYQLAYAARERSESHLAMLAAERALRIPLPRDDRLFVETPAHTYGPLEEISISAFYTGEHQRGMAASDVLLHDRAVAAESRLLAGRNTAFYAQPLPVAWSIPIEITDDFDAPGYSPGNATICRTDDGYLLIVRLVNYEQHGGVSFVSRHEDGRFRSKNLHLFIDADLQILSSWEIDSSLLEQVQPDYAPDIIVEGIEDLRLIRWNNAWWFVANSRAFDPSGCFSLVLGRLDASASKIEHLVPLEYSERREHEKNWLPFVVDDRLLLLYSCDPTTILEPDPETGLCRKVDRVESETCFDRYRGSSPPIPFGNGYLFTIHEVTLMDGRRVYLHRFVEMDQEFRIRRVSRLFKIWHLGIEYNCGMCLSHNGDDLLMAWSYEDQQSWILSVPLDNVERMLLPVEEVSGMGMRAAHTPTVPNETPVSS